MVALFASSLSTLTRALVAMALLLLTLPTILSRQSDSKHEFEETTARGRLIAQYLVALENAAKAVRALRSSDEGSLLYVARKSDAGWRVAAGRLGPNRDAFLTSYSADESSNGQDFVAQKYDVPLQDFGFYCTAARAIDVSLQDFQGQNRRHNAVVLPADSNRFYVYVLPAQTTPGLYLLGGDVRYLVSVDGSAIIEKHEMHKSIIEFGRKPDKAPIPVAGIHSHVLTGVPEDSDVAYVLIRKPSVPEFIKTHDHLFLVEVDGTIIRKQ